jgi:hypothetical protein
MSSVKHYGVPERPVNTMLENRPLGIRSRMAVQIWQGQDLGVGGWTGTHGRVHVIAERVNI